MTHGHVMSGAFRYDVNFLVRTLGRERAFRNELLDLARVAEGESVLDVGCGTGSLAIAAKRRVGARGTVHGVDPSHEFLARARAKARRARTDVSFAEGTAQSLRFADASFDVALATMTLHHLPSAELHDAARELRRVVRPGGRVLAVDLDLDHPGNPRGGPHAHGSGAQFDLANVAKLFAHFGFTVVAEGPVTFRLVRFERMRYVLLG